jgi:hypothetical protein
MIWSSDCPACTSWRITERICCAIGVEESATDSPLQTGQRNWLAMSCVRWSTLRGRAETANVTIQTASATARMASAIWTERCRRRERQS